MADKDKVLFMEEYSEKKIFCEICKKEIKKEDESKLYGSERMPLKVHRSCLILKILAVCKGLRKAGCSSENLQRIENNFLKSDAGVFFNLELLRMAISQFRSDHAEEFGFYQEFSDLYRVVFGTLPDTNKPFLS